MIQEEHKIPKVFISYSHDNPSHKRWVAELAMKLREKGVDVILDQWNLKLGVDPLKFMEDSIAPSDRVLMICTEKYVEKADRREGGTGYEGMIISAEIYLNYDTSKFIPIIRQKPGSDLLPKFLGRRLYCNLSEDQNYAEQFEILLRDLHEVPAVPKPPIGKSPFETEVMGKESSPSSVIKEITNLEDINSIYKIALTISQKGDILSWRRIIRQALSPIPGKLNQWRSKYEREIPSIVKEELPSMVLDGLSIYAPLFSIALAGVQSLVEKFNNQVPILDEILFPKDWNRSEYIIITDFPETVAFFFQALHGAMCLLTGQIHLAIGLVRNVKELHSSESKSLWAYHGIMGWPKSLLNTVVAWETLINLFDKIPWLKDLFNSKDEYIESICAYYMALNVLEYVETIASGKEQIFSEDSVLLDIPVHFIRMNEEITRRAYHLLKIDTEQVIDIWRKRDITDSKIREHWENWMRICQVWLNKVYPDYYFASRFKIPHKNLINDIFGT